MKRLIIPSPDDFHLHLRDGVYLNRTVLDSAKQFCRAIIMPNLKPALTTIPQIEAYRKRILKIAKKKYPAFTPLMTLYLTSDTTVQTIREAAQHPHIYACKLYPAGATTHAEAGIRSLRQIYPIFEIMQKSRLPLLIHGEAIDPQVDVFDREAFFIEKELIPLRKKFPDLPIVLEHITTKEAVEYIEASNSHTAATLTAHHLLFNRNSLFKNGLCPDYYCLPVLKRKKHQDSLLKAAISANPKFFLGTDSAPHARGKKIAVHACAGMYTAYAAIELYAEIFERLNALPKLADFASRFGATFYRLPLNTGQLTLEKRPWKVPSSLKFGKTKLKPLYGGEILKWKLVSCTPVRQAA